MTLPSPLGKAQRPGRGVSATSDVGERIFCAEPAVCPCGGHERPVYRPCPISHVPVAACRLVGIRSTAGQPPGVLKDRWSTGWIPSGRHPGGNTGPRQQPAAGGETGEPRSPRGTQLKATTNGLFWSRRPSKGRHRRGLFLFARRAVGNPLPIQGSFRVLSRPRSTRVSKARDASRRSAPRRRAAHAVQISTTRPTLGRLRTCGLETS
jgi:hypothetical protein